MLTDPGVDGGAANYGSERLSGAFSVGDRDGWPTAIVGLMCLIKACQHGKAHQACRLKPIVAQTSCISTFYSHMSQNVELAARPIEVEFDQRPLYRRQISFGERPGEAFQLPVMTYHGHLSPPQLPTPILSRIGVEVVRARPDPLRTVFRSHFRLRAKLTRETAILVRRCFVKLSRTL